SKLQSHLRSKFQCIREGNAQQGNPILLNDIFTELLITEGGDGAINEEHEIRQIEDACKNKGMEEIVIKCNDIFQPLPGRNKRIRTVLTKGIAGIGKTVSVQKFILDWAEGKANQDINYIFPLPFRDLNLKVNGQYSVMQLLHQYFPELKELKTIRSEEVKTVFIFDGLDECRLHLDFRNNEMCCDLTKKIPVNALLTNLIQGNLLPSALLWITSRPAAANHIPPECVDQVTEVRGFNDSDKENYFRKRFSDQGLAEKIIKHIKSSRSLHIMCHIPVFCWISATVLEKMLDKSDMEVPKTLTQMYTHFLLIQTHLKNKKYHGVIQDNMELLESDKEMLFKLSKLAFLQLEKQNLIFYETDLTECDIDVSKATEYSAICTEIFKEEFGLYREKVFCFVHLSIQEHLAALHAQLNFTNSHINILQEDTENHSKPVKMSDLHKSAVDKALKSKNGHFDLFLRFLLGLSLDSNQALLRSLLPKPCSESLEETVNYIKEKIRMESSAERTINLFHCLNELNYNSLVEEIHNFLRSGQQSEKELQPDQCSALAYVLLTSENVMNEFDLKMCNTSPEGYRRLLPVVKTSRKASLAGINLTDESCETLASILQSANSHLVELDLSFNSLGDLGVKLLCTGLMNPQSKLEKLTLSHNELEHIGVKLLCDFFQSAHSQLKELDLGSNNDIKDSGVKLLSAGLISVQCKLEKLRLDRCDLSQESCEALKTALQLPNSCLKQLDLSYNKIGDSGVQHLCDGLIHPNCKLELLDLSYNNLGQSGIKLLSTGLMNADCKLRSIRLADIGIQEETCETLALVLQSENPHLRELDLSNNYIGDVGVELLCVGLISPKCSLEKLSLRWCNLTERSCTNLASVLSSHSRLTELELRDNDVKDSGLKLLCVGLQGPGCSLQKLGLSGCCVTEDGCAALALALSSDHSKLREIDLSYNHPGESGVRQLSAVRDNPHFHLEKLSHINILQEDTENHSKPVKMSDLHKSAVDRALKSKNGHFDLFLRFLLGLSLDSNQALLRILLPKPCSESLEETVNYIKEKIRMESSAERTINLFHCLNELNYNSLVEEIHNFLRSGQQSEKELQPDQCSALAYVLLTSENVMNEFDLKMCNTSPEGYRRLLPVVKTSRKASLAGVNLTDESCETLASILQSANSHLVELDLSFNSLGDLGVKLLCTGLSNPQSKLEKLTLSHNELEHIGVKLLCDCLMSTHCKLQTLGLAGTNFSSQSCEIMASVFQSAHSQLKELDLGSNNDIKDSGVKLLSAGLISVQCKLEKLRLDRCDLSHESCEALKTALQSPNSCLKQLDLSYNKLGDSGVQHLCDGLTHPNCKMELLDLSYNNLGHSGIKLLSTGLMNADCKLRSIRLADIGIQEETCETLALVLQSENPHLRELDLSNNYIGDLGVELLCVGLISPKCSLEKLSLSGCCVTEDGCAALALALSSDHSKLREIDLSYNHPGESGVRQLSAVRDNPHFHLEKLR
ncbi:NACHT, LRR and PYD domains-containing protein 12-like isoform X1, partial [Silurus asotus]